MSSNEITCDHAEYSMWECLSCSKKCCEDCIRESYDIDLEMKIYRCHSCTGWKRKTTCDICKRDTPGRYDLSLCSSCYISCCMKCRYNVAYGDQWYQDRIICSVCGKK